MAAGRRPPERMRTSLMLHMIRENQNTPWEKVAVDVGGEGAKGATDRVAKFNALLRNSVADEDTCFVDKCQEAAQLAQATLEKVADGKQPLADTELGQRNLLCIKFLSGNYQEVIRGRKEIPARDGLSLMLVAAAYYAAGKFRMALSVYQRAAIELTSRIGGSPEHTVHCAKLFNNMGCAYFEMGKFERAMQAFQRALQLFHGDDEGDPAAWTAAILDQACIMNNMAYVLIKFRQYGDACDLVDASFELQQILPGDANVMTISTLSTMAFIYYRTKKYKLSLDTYSACVQLQDKNPMYNESDIVEILGKMVGVCKKTKDHEKRVYLLRCTLVYQQCYLLDNDDEIYETNAALADALQAFADSGGTMI